MTPKIIIALTLLLGLNTIRDSEVSFEHLGPLVICSPGIRPYSNPKTPWRKSF